MLLHSELGEKYPRLSQEDIFSAIEIAAIRVSKIMLGKTVQANVDEDGLHMYSLDAGDIKEVNLRGIKRIIDRPLLDEIESELMLRDAAVEALQYKALRGSVVTGIIDSRKPNGDYVVYIEIAGLTTTMLLADLPRNQQCDKDYYRGVYDKGSTLSFHHYSSQVVRSANRAWVRHIVSRTTKDFPCALLQKITGLSGIKCTTRKPGEYSEIISYYRLPKSAINTVGKELKETLNVKSVKQA